MLPLEPEPTLKVYLLLKQTGLSFAPCGYSSNSLPSSIGFYTTRNEAEIARTHELLMSVDRSDHAQYHIYELDIPNVAYRIPNPQNP